MKSNRLKRVLILLNVFKAKLFPQFFHMVSPSGIFRRGMECIAHDELRFIKSMIHTQSGKRRKKFNTLCISLPFKEMKMLTDLLVVRMQLYKPEKN